MVVVLWIVVALTVLASVDSFSIVALSAAISGTSPSTATTTKRQATNTLNHMATVDNSDSSSSSSSSSPPHCDDSSAMYIVFGRPGAGKTTIADQVIRSLQQQQQQGDKRNVLGIDLDVCVPRWMRDNFAKGIYPTLEQRQQFAQSACDYVINEQQGLSSSSSSMTTIISFSFVNSDLRDVFRQRFPNAHWILIDTSETEAQQRIEQREGHFYKGKVDAAEQQQQQQQQRDKQQDTATTTTTTTTTTLATQSEDKDNFEWEFAPVEFDHVVLDGSDSIDQNVERILVLISQNQI